MKKRILAFLTAVVTLLSMTLPAFAADEDGEAVNDRASRQSGRVVVARVRMYTDRARVRVNQSTYLFAAIVPVNATDQDLTWTSSDTDIVTVDDEGEITGVSPGTAVITATASNGRSDSCTVTVPETALSQIHEDVKNESVPGNTGSVMATATIKTLVEQACENAKSSETPIVSLENRGSLSQSAMKGAKYTADYHKRTVLIQNDTTDADGRVEGRLTIDTGLIKDPPESTGLYVYTNGDKTGSVEQLFQNGFQHNVAVVRTSHTGSFNMNVGIAAKVDLAGMDQSTLQFYLYDSDANKYDDLAVQGVRVDSAGYLHFTTGSGGYIVVTDRPLSTE